MSHAVYALICPESGLIRYVGRTKRPLADRVSGHWNNPMRNLTPWLEGLRGRGLRPIARILSRAPKEAICEEERKWISAFSANPLEADLLNRQVPRPKKPPVVRPPKRVAIIVVRPPPPPRQFGPKRLRRRLRDYLNRLAVSQ